MGQWDVAGGADIFCAAVAVIVRVHWHVTRLAGAWYGLMHCHSATRTDIMSPIRFVIPQKALTISHPYALLSRDKS